MPKPKRTPPKRPVSPAVILYFLEDGRVTTNPWAEPEAVDAGEPTPSLSLEDSEPPHEPGDTAVNLAPQDEFPAAPQGGFRGAPVPVQGKRVSTTAPTPVPPEDTDGHSDLDTLDDADFAAARAAASFEDLTPLPPTMPGFSFEVEIPHPQHASARHSLEDEAAPTSGERTVITSAEDFPWMDQDKTPQMPSRQTSKSGKPMPPPFPAPHSAQSAAQGPFSLLPEEDVPDFDFETDLRSAGRAQISADEQPLHSAATQIEQLPGGPKIGGSSPRGNPDLDGLDSFLKKAIGEACSEEEIARAFAVVPTQRPAPADALPLSQSASGRSASGTSDAPSQSKTARAPLGSSGMTLTDTSASAAGSSESILGNVAPRRRTSSGGTIPAQSPRAWERAAAHQTPLTRKSPSRRATPPPVQALQPAISPIAAQPTPPPPVQQPRPQPIYETPAPAPRPVPAFSGSGAAPDLELASLCLLKSQEAQEYFQSKLSPLAAHSGAAAQKPQLAEWASAALFGQKLFATGRPQPARKIFERLVSGHPDAAFPYAMMGALCLAQGNDAEADRLFDTALTQDPSDLCALLGKAEVCLREARPEDALAELNLAIGQAALEKSALLPKAEAMLAVAKQMVLFLG